MFTVQLINKKLAKLTLNTDAPIFSKVFELPYDNVVLGDRETAYIFSSPADAGYSLTLSVTVPEQGDIYSDFLYVKLIPGNEEDFTGRGVKY